MPELETDPEALALAADIVDERFGGGALPQATTVGIVSLLLSLLAAADVFAEGVPWLSALNEDTPATVPSRAIGAENMDEDSAAELSRLKLFKCEPLLLTLVP